MKSKSAYSALHAALKGRIHRYYWTHDYNCAEATLRILSEAFGVTLQDQVLDAAAGMHGAGEYGAQCGLVEGGLMFIGIVGRQEKSPEREIIETCRKYAQEFERRFGSLLCRELRPEGFSPENPPHICEPRTGEALMYDIAFMTDLIGRHPQLEETVQTNPEGEPHE